MDEYSALWRPGTETVSSRTAPLAPARAPAREFFLAKALSFGARARGRHSSRQRGNVSRSQRPSLESRQPTDIPSAATRGNISHGSREAREGRRRRQCERGFLDAATLSRRRRVGGLSRVRRASTCGSASEEQPLERRSSSGGVRAGDLSRVAGSGQAGSVRHSLIGRFVQPNERAGKASAVVIINIHAASPPPPFSPSCIVYHRRRRPLGL